MENKECFGFYDKNNIECKNCDLFELCKNVIHKKRLFSIFERIERIEKILRGEI